MTSPPATDPVQGFVEELLRTGLGLIDLLGTLVEEMPEGAFEGEDNAAVLVEMVVGSCRPALLAMGEADCRRATALMETVWERVMADLRAAAALSVPQGRS